MTSGRIRSMGLPLLLLLTGLVLACRAEKPEGWLLVEADSPAVHAGRLVETIGIEVSVGEIEPILERRCEVPCHESVTFETADPGQSELLIYIFRGNSRATERSDALGVFEVSGFPVPIEEPGESGDEMDEPGPTYEVVIGFHADEDGVYVSLEKASDPAIVLRPAPGA